MAMQSTKIDLALKEMQWHDALCLETKLKDYINKENKKFC